MGFLRNILALIGIIALVGLVYGYQKFGGDLRAINEFDSEFKPTFSSMWQKLKETGTTADATVWVVPVNDDISAEDAEEAMKIVANDRNIMNVGEQPLSEQVALQTGEDQRFLKIFQFCDPLTAVKMVAYTDAFSAYLPCRVALVEGKDGKLRLFSLNMDLMIHGGKELPPELKEEALKVKQTIQEIMNAGATGDFF